MRNQTVIQALATYLPLAVAGFLSTTVYADDAWEAKKQELDAICEQAREERLSVDRAAGVEECVEKGMREDRAGCERFFASYGQGNSNAGALYYDLPECQRAFEHRQSQRNRDYRREHRNDPQ